MARHAPRKIPYPTKPRLHAHNGPLGQLRPASACFYQSIPIINYSVSRRCGVVNSRRISRTCLRTCISAASACSNHHQGRRQCIVVTASFPGSNVWNSAGPLFKMYHWISTSPMDLNFEHWLGELPFDLVSIMPIASVAMIMRRHDHSDSFFLKSPPPGWCGSWIMLSS